jgi:hypothetical protein
MALLSPNELFSPDFITFLLHRHPDLRQPVSSWLEKAGRGIPKQQRLELFLLACGPPQVLKEAQEDFIRLVGHPSSLYIEICFADVTAAPSSVRHVPNGCSCN